MKLKTLLENTIKLTNLYTESELDDESELLYNFVDPDMYENDFTIHIMTPEQAKTYKTADNSTTVYQAFMDFATKNQKRLVNAKSKKWDDNRIIIVDNNMVIDGNHHLIAGIFANKNIKYINLAETV